MHCYQGLLLGDASQISFQVWKQGNAWLRSFKCPRLHMLPSQHANTTWRMPSLLLPALQAIQQPRPAQGPSPPLTDLPLPAAVAPGTAELAAARAALTAALPILRECAQGGPHGRRRMGGVAGTRLPHEHQVATL